MTVLAGIQIPFTVNERGDQITTSRLQLDDGAPPVSIACRYQPSMGRWLTTVSSTDGTVFVSDRGLEHQEDVLDNIVTTGRPRGAIVCLTSDGLAPTRTVWTDGGQLVYFPDGITQLWDGVV